jgi:hypothetical protein
VHVFLSDPEVMTVSGLALPRSIQKPLQSTLPAGAPFCREWSRVQLDSGSMEAPMHAVLERGTANVAFWRPGRDSATAYTHVFEPSAVVRTQWATFAVPATRRRIARRATERTIELADGIGAIADATSFDAVTLHVNWSGRPLGTSHLAHHGAVVSPLWVSDVIARQLTADILDARLGVGARRRVHDRVQRLLRSWLQPFREFVKDVGQTMDPAALLPRFRPHRTDGGPEAERTVADGDDGRTQAAAPQIPQHRCPAVGALAVAVLNRDEFLRAVGAHANHHERAEAILLEPHAEVHAIDPHVHVIDVVQIPLPPGVILPLPRRR